ncbi:MAG TPA: efflux RND transporter periplasmic adaptor subunit [Thermoanaerobaculia bacterium]|nr:efflux RND transporter periplasmic adaptor subunit [Thermoanaerobaculia bacterium]
MSRNRWIWIGSGALLLAIVVVASLAGGPERGELVYAEPVRPRDIQAVVSAPGQIDPKVKVNISAHVIGKIERLYFEEGDSVERGERLVDLEKIGFRAAAEQAASLVANRRIDVERARIGLESARRNWERAQALHEQGILNQELLERSRLDYDNARSMLASAEEAVRQAEAALRQAREDLDRTTIIAPISGRIVQKNAQEGEVVITGTMNNPGSVIAVLADLSEVLVEAEVGETEVVRIRPGQRARIRVDAVPEAVFDGTVAEIGSSATQRAGVATGIRYFKVKIAIDQPDERLRPGMTAQVEIITESVENARTVPVQSVVERNPEDVEKKRAPARSPASDDRPKEKYVFVVEEGVANAVRVTTGISNPTHVVITSGLDGDETVVTGPFRTLRNLKNGEAVRIETEDEEERQNR